MRTSSPRRPQLAARVHDPLGCARHLASAPRGDYSWTPSSTIRWPLQKVVFDRGRPTAVGTMFVSLDLTAQEVSIGLCAAGSIAPRLLLTQSIALHDRTRIRQRWRRYQARRPAERADGTRTPDPLHAEGWVAG
jgi:hypothetical protein